jgi:hypothetical protein
MPGSFLGFFAHKQSMQSRMQIAEPSNCSADYVLENRWETLQ